MRTSQVGEASPCEAVSPPPNTFLSPEMRLPLPERSSRVGAVSAGDREFRARVRCRVFQAVCCPRRREQRERTPTLGIRSRRCEPGHNSACAGTLSGQRGPAQGVVPASHPAKTRACPRLRRAALG